MMHFVSSIWIPLCQGLAANDYGDSIRFGANHSAEDEPDLSKVNFSLEFILKHIQRDFWKLPEMP